jgi:hypothetical protein
MTFCPLWWRVWTTSSCQITHRWRSCERSSALRPGKANIPSICPSCFTLPYSTLSQMQEHSSPSRVTAIRLLQHPSYSSISFEVIVTLATRAISLRMELLSHCYKLFPFVQISSETKIYSFHRIVCLKYPTCIPAKGIDICTPVLLNSLHVQLTLTRNWAIRTNVHTSWTQMEGRMRIFRHYW